MGFICGSVMYHSSCQRLRMPVDGSALIQRTIRILQTGDKCQKAYSHTQPKLHQDHQHQRLPGILKNSSGVLIKPVFSKKLFTNP